MLEALMLANSTNKKLRSWSNSTKKWACIKSLSVATWNSSWMISFPARSLDDLKAKLFRRRHPLQLRRQLRQLKLRKLQISVPWSFKNWDKNTIYLNSIVLILFPYSRLFVCLYPPMYNNKITITIVIFNNLGEGTNSIVIKRIATSQVKQLLSSFTHLC